MELKAGHTRIRAHPLLLLMPLLAVRLGMPRETAAMALSLALHEAAHLAAARLSGARVEELRLMPFGGTLKMGNLYALPAGRLFLIAAAGPAANLALMIMSAALAQWGAIAPEIALKLLRVNLTLMLFNLLPALPLDGGRMLYALTQGWLGRKRAAGLGVWLGRALAAALAIGAAWGFVSTRKLNLSMLGAAVFILSAEAGEKAALGEVRAASLLNALKPIGAPVPVRLFAVDARCPARRALRDAAPDTAVLYAVYAGGSLAGFADERQLIDALITDSTATVKSALGEGGRFRGRSA